MIAAWLPPFGTLAGEVARAVLVLLGFFALIGAAEAWHRRASPPTEWTRKLVHFGAGAMASAFPWIFSSHWTLLAVAAIGAGPILLARARGGLRSVLGIERESLGDVYFPLAIYSLFLIAKGQPVFYLVSLLTMVVADALAAVLGRAYGKHQYLVTTHRRSIEGSVVFFFTAFLVVHLPLLLATDLDRAAGVLVAAQIALLVASFEAIGTNGSDNLLVPLAAYYLLVKLTPRPVEAIAVQLGCQVAILLAMLVIARRTRFLSFSGAVAAHLMLYAAFSLGGPAWIVAPALALSAAIVMENRRRRTAHAPSPGHHVAVVFYVSIAAVLLIFADNTFATLVSGPHGLGRGHPFYAPFVGSLAGAIAIVAWLSLEATPRARHRSPAWRVAVAGATGFTVVGPLGLLAVGGDGLAVGFATAAVTCAGSLALFLGLRRMVPRPAGQGWNLRYLALAVLGATLALLPIHFHWIRAIDWRLR